MSRNFSISSIPNFCRSTRLHKNFLAKIIHTIGSTYENIPKTENFQFQNQSLGEGKEENSPEATKQHYLSQFVNLGEKGEKLNFFNYFF